MKQQSREQTCIFEPGALQTPIEIPVRLDGGHFIWRDHRGRRIISEVTNVCGRVEKGRGCEEVLEVSWTFSVDELEKKNYVEKRRKWSEIMVKADNWEYAPLSVKDLKGSLTFWLVFPHFDCLYCTYWLSIISYKETGMNVSSKGGRYICCFFHYLMIQYNNINYSMTLKHCVGMCWHLNMHNV